VSLNTKTKIMVWGRASGLCSMPECRRELVVDNEAPENPSLLGEVCHIVGDKPTSARHDPSFSQEQLDNYDNLILLCRNHHKLVDDQTARFTVHKLHEMKEAHVEWVRASRGTFDAARQQDDETYGGYVDGWEQRANAAGWTVWSSRIMSAEGPRMTVALQNQLEELGTWLLARVWPSRYPELKLAFDNFRVVLADFLGVFAKHTHVVGSNDDDYWTEKFYHIREWNASLYDKLYREYVFHCNLVDDLMLELTRAANYLSDCVRRHLLKSYRLAEGAFLVQSGPYLNSEPSQSLMVHYAFRVEYKPTELTPRPYPGLAEFKRMRVTRDRHVGSGTNSREMNESEL